MRETPPSDEGTIIPFPRAPRPRPAQVPDETPEGDPDGPDGPRAA